MHLLRSAHQKFIDEMTKKGKRSLQMPGSPCALLQISILFVFFWIKELLYVPTMQTLEGLHNYNCMPLKY